MTRQDAIAVTFDFSDPRRSAALAVGAAAAPFWAPLFATAAGAGVAWWWMTGWTRLNARTAPDASTLVEPTLVEPTPVAGSDVALSVSVETDLAVEEPATTEAVEAAADTVVVTDAEVDVLTQVQSETTPAPAATARPKGRKAPKAKSSSRTVN